MVHFLTISRKHRESPVPTNSIQQKNIPRVSFSVESKSAPNLTVCKFSCKDSASSLLDSVRRSDSSSVRILADRVFAGGMSMLMIASREGDVDTCRLLISAGHHLNTQDNRGYTALMYAARDGYSSIVKLLLNAGADASICTKSGYNALFCASLNGYATIVSDLCTFVDSNVCDDEGVTPIICACINNHVDTVMILLKNGADPTIRDKSGRSAIMHALDLCNIQVIAVFFQKGIYMEYSLDTLKCGVLFLAAARRQKDLVKLLVRNSLYLGEFVDNLVSCSNIATEAVVENAIRGVLRDLSMPERIDLGNHMINKVNDCIHQLLSVYYGTDGTSPLSGLVEASVWCIRVYKLFCGNAPSEILEFFWTFVERLIAECESGDCVEMETSSETSDEGDEILVMIPSCSRQVKLMFSFIEIYCIGMGSVLGERDEFKGCMMESSSRLVTLFRNHSKFIQGFVKENASIYRHMVYFAKAYIQFMP